MNSATTQLAPPAGLLPRHSLPQLVAEGEIVGSVLAGERPGQNVRLHPDGRHLVAQTSGEIVRGADGAVTVLPILVIAGNVNHVSGNVESEGSILIRGDVQQGCSVHSGMSLYVEGSVEAAELTAHRRVTVLGGMQGNGASRIVARDTVSLKFAQYTTITTPGDVVVAGALAYCQVVCGGRFICQGPGATMGGSVRAGGGATFYDLGSCHHVPTQVQVGLDPIAEVRCERLREQLHDLRQQQALEDENARYLAAEHGMTFPDHVRSIEARIVYRLRQLALPECPRNQRSLLHREALHLLATWSMEREIETAAACLEQAKGAVRLEPRAAVRVQGSLYPGVELRIRDATWRSEQEYFDVTFSYTSEGIVLHS